MPSAAPDLLAAMAAAARRIVETRRAELPEAVLDRRQAPRAADRRFLAALREGREPRVIAECKRRSPSKGILREQYDPAAIAAAYEQHGAAAISVLTEPGFFDGSLDHLAAVRRAVQIPVLRKDFIVSPYQLAEARSAGADAVLLIAAALTEAELNDLLRGAETYGMDALVEVHDEEELERAVSAGAAIIGVNSRNLHTLAVDLAVFDRLARRMPRGVVAVAESGLKDAQTVTALRAEGYRAFLIGERFMTADDPGAALSVLLKGTRA